MACNCGKNKTLVQYRLTSTSGRVTIHGTRRSAELADQRNGGGGTIEKVG